MKKFFYLLIMLNLVSITRADTITTTTDAPPAEPPSNIVGIVAKSNAGCNKATSEITSPADTHIIGTVSKPSPCNNPNNNQSPTINGVNVIVAPNYPPNASGNGNTATPIIPIPQPNYSVGSP